MADNTADDVNVTDQESLTTEEKALLDQMEKDGDGAGDDGGAPPLTQQKQSKVPKAPKAPKQPVQSAEAEEEVSEEVEEEGEAAQVGKTVPLAALHESRTQTKALRDELKQSQDAHKAEMAKAMDRFERAIAAFAPKPPEPVVEKVPDFETDPAGWIAHTMKSTGKELEDVRKELKTLQDDKAQKVEQDKQTSVIRGIMDYAVTKENEFKAANPDYDEASAFLINSRKEELADLGYPEAQIMQMIQGEKLTIAAQAKEQGKNPAELVYNIAKRRGFQKKVPAAGDGNGQQPQDDKARIETVRKGTEHGTGLSGARGNAPSPLTAQRLLELSEADFDKAIQTPEGRALLGL